MADTTIAKLLKFGRAVRDARHATGLSQEDFAEAAGLHRTYIGHIERGEANISFENIVKVARAARIKPSTLWTRAGL